MLLNALETFFYAWVALTFLYGVFVQGRGIFRFFRKAIREAKLEEQAEKVAKAKKEEVNVGS